MINLIKKTYFTSILFLFPLLTFAVGPEYVPPTKPETVNDVFFSFAWGNMKGLIPALITVALITFLAGVIKFVKSGDNEEARTNGRNIMIYGIIVLFVMVAFWGITDLIVKTFFTTGTKIPNYLPLD
jgi:phage-related holin